MSKDDEQWPFVITVRINEYMVNGIDRMVGKLRLEKPGMTVSVSDVIRTILIDAIKDEDE
jgi:hypothetical protein